MEDHTFTLIHMLENIVASEVDSLPDFSGIYLFGWYLMCSQEYFTKMPMACIMV